MLEAAVKCGTIMHSSVEDLQIMRKNILRAQDNWNLRQDQGKEKQQGNHKQDVIVLFLKGLQWHNVQNEQP